VSKNKLLLSIIICSNDRKKELSDCINSLINQKYPKESTEILIIDNGKKSIAKKVFTENKNKIKNLRYIKEKRQGLSISRNLGFRKAKGDYVYYIDDDTILDISFIKGVLKLIKSRPQIKVFGGPSDRHFYKNPPDWFPQNYGINNFGNKIKKLETGKEWIGGYSMGFKKEILVKIGGFKNSLGMNGKVMAYGEETLLQVKLKKNNINIYYIPNIKLSHLVADYKLSLNWLLKSSFKRGLVRFKSHGEEPNLIDTLKSIFIGEINFIKYLFYPHKLYPKYRLYKMLSNKMSSFGKLIEYFRYRLRLK
jgi:GT2 family glycosyltransferase